METRIVHIQPCGNWVFGQASSSTFNLPSHVEFFFTANQSAEIIADHFAAISRNYEPISLHNFPPNIKDALSHPDLSVVPKLEEYEVYKKICKAKKPNSTVPGDLPKKIVSEFSCELASPVTIIYKSILSNLQYPRQWVVEGRCAKRPQWCCCYSTDSN